MQLRHRCRLESVSDKGDHVIANVHDLDKDKHFEITARHVVDCSGGRSDIRPPSTSR